MVVGEAIELLIVFSTVIFTLALLYAIERFTGDDTKELELAGTNMLCRFAVECIVIRANNVCPSVQGGERCRYVGA